MGTSLPPGLLQRDRRRDGFARRRIFQCLRLGNQLHAARDFRAAHRIAPLVERPEDLVEALSQRTLALRARGGQRAHAPDELAALRLQLVIARRGAFRAGEPCLQLVADRGTRLCRGLLLRRALGAQFEHRLECAREDGVEALPLRLARGTRCVALLPVVAERAY